jgi:MFS family permease
LNVPPPAEREYPRPLLAWLTLGALFVAYIFSFIDRMIIGLLVEPIKADLGLSDTEISLLQGLAFALFFTLAGLPIGRLIDRAPRMKIVAAGIALWSGMTALCGWVTGFWHFFFLRMGVGVGEAVLSPAAYSIIADSFPRRRLGLAMGVYGLGSAIGAGLAFMIGALVIALVVRSGGVNLPLIGEMAPWQFAFVCAGVPGFLVAAVFLLIPEPPREDGDKFTPVPIRQVVQEVQGKAAIFWSIFLGVAAINFAVLGTVSWLPAMLMRGHGMTASEAGLLAGSLLIAGGLIGMIGGGIAMDRFRGGAPASRLQFCAGATLLGIPGALVFPFLDSTAGFAAGFLIFFSAAAVTVGAAPSTIQQITPGRMRATVSAFYVFIINLVGLGIGPTATAIIGDVFFAFDDGIRYAIAVIAPAGYIVAFILFARAARLLGALAASTAPLPVPILASR